VTLSKLKNIYFSSKQISKSCPLRQRQRKFYLSASYLTSLINKQLNLEKTTRNRLTKWQRSRLLAAVRVDDFW